MVVLNTTWRQWKREFYEVREVFWTKPCSQNLEKLNSQRSSRNMFRSVCVNLESHQQFHINLTFYNLKFLMFVNLLRLCLRHISLLKLSKWRNFPVSFKIFFFFLSFIFKFNPSEIDFYIWCELGVQFPFLGIQIISYIGIMYWLVLPSWTNQQC